MSFRSDAECVLRVCMPSCPEPFIHAGGRWLTDITIADFAWIDFADPMTSMIHPLLVADSGTWKSMAIRLCARVAREAFPSDEIPAMFTREAVVEELAGRPISNTSLHMRRGFSVLPELGLLFESMDASYNKGKRDFMLEMLEGHIIGKLTKTQTIQQFTIHSPYFSATTQERLMNIIPSRLDMNDGLPVRFCPVLITRKLDDDMPPIIQPTILLPLINSMKKLRADLAKQPMRLVHGTQSTPIYQELVKQGKRDVRSLKMHPASFSRAKTNFSRICISEEISNFGVASTNISTLSAEVAKKDSIEYARNMFKLYTLMGPDASMRELMSLVRQSMPKGISKTILRNTSGQPNKLFTEAYDSLSVTNGCGIITEEKIFVKTKPITMVKLA